MPTRSGAVHVAITRRRYKGKIYRTILLRRSYRDGSSVKHETLGNISHLPDLIVDLIRRSLGGERFVSTTDAFEIVKSAPHGHVEAVVAALRALDLENLLSSTRSRERDLVLAMITERLIHPSSKLATTRLWHSTTLAEEFKVEDAGVDELYEALDWLLTRKERIEGKLASKHLKDGALVLYDASSTYYYGRTCPLAQFGYSRDAKKGLPVIVFGLLTDREGRPVAVDVYPGNTGDPTTVRDQVKKLREHFGLSRVVIVGDRGMITQTQIETFRDEEGLGWISCLRNRSIRELVSRGSLNRSLFDEKNLAEIRSPSYPGERLIACFNPLLAEERRRKRLELLQATQEDLERLAKEVKRRKHKLLGKAEIGLKAGRLLNRFKMGKLFTLKIGDGVFEWSRREDEIEREAQLDGIYVVRTSEPPQRFSAKDTVRTYKSLALVERAFRCLKGIDVLVRPIHHRLEDRVRAHIFLCMLTYYVEWHMRKALAPLLFQDEELGTLRTRDPVATAEPSESVRQKKTSRLTNDGLPLQSFRTLLATLGTRSRNTCRVKSDPTGAVFQQLTLPTPLQARAFELLQRSQNP